MLLKKDLYFQSIALCAVLLYIPLYSMEQSKPSKKSKQVKKLRRSDQELITIDQTKPFAGFTKDIVRTVVLPYLSLQEMSRFYQTSMVYRDAFNPAKMRKTTLGCSQLEMDYYRCSQALGRFAVYHNEKMFDQFFLFDRGTRHTDIMRVYKRELFDNKTRMHFYRKYYGTPEEVEQRVADCIRNAISKEIFETLCIIKYNIFKVFGLYEQDDAFQKLCKICLENKDVDPLVNLIPDNEEKSEAVQRVCKYDQNGQLLERLLKKEVIKSTDQYGDGCTLLHYAALRGFPNLALHLLARLADRHAINKWGKTPLHYACKFAPTMIGIFVNQKIAIDSSIDFKSLQKEIQKKHEWKTPITLDESIWIRSSSHHVHY